jgi:hypothetical protein
MKGAGDYLSKFKMVSAKVDKKAFIGAIGQNSTIDFMTRKGFQMSECENDECHFTREQSKSQMKLTKYIHAFGYNPSVLSAKECSDIPQSHIITIPNKI